MKASSLYFYFERKLELGREDSSEVEEDKESLFRAGEGTLVASVHP